MNYDLLQTTYVPSAFKQFYIVLKYYNTGGASAALFHRDVPKILKMKNFPLLENRKNLTPEKQDKTLGFSKHWSPDSTLARNEVIMKMTYPVNQ